MKAPATKNSRASAKTVSPAPPLAAPVLHAEGRIAADNSARVLLAFLAAWR